LTEASEEHEVRVANVEAIFNVLERGEDKRLQSCTGRPKRAAAGVEGFFLYTYTFLNFTILAWAYNRGF
jgi:hypothetical protein